MLHTRKRTYTARTFSRIWLLLSLPASAAEWLLWCWQPSFASIWLVAPTYAYHCKPELKTKKMRGLNNARLLFAIYYIRHRYSAQPKLLLHHQKAAFTLIHILSNCRHTHTCKQGSSIFCINKMRNITLAKWRKCIQRKEGTGSFFYYLFNAKAARCTRMQLWVLAKYKLLSQYCIPLFLESRARPNGWLYTQKVFQHKKCLLEALCLWQLRKNIICAGGGNKHNSNAIREHWR